MMTVSDFRNVSIFSMIIPCSLYQEYHGSIPIEEAYRKYARDPDAREWKKS